MQKKLKVLSDNCYRFLFSYGIFFFYIRKHCSTMTKRCKMLPTQIPGLIHEKIILSYRTRARRTTKKGKIPPSTVRESKSHSTIKNEVRGSQSMKELSYDSILLELPKKCPLEDEGEEEEQNKWIIVEPAMESPSTSLPVVDVITVPIKMSISSRLQDSNNEQEDSPNKRDICNPSVRC
jgi:hypothetical protein